MTEQEAKAAQVLIDAHKGQTIPISVTIAPGGALIIVVLDVMIQSVILSAINGLYKIEGERVS